jgi:outer membrane protein TolC
MRRKVLLRYELLIAGILHVAYGGRAQGAVPADSLKLTLPAALGLALNENRDLLVSKMSLEGDHFLVDAADAEFAPKLIPSLSAGKTGTQASFFDGASSTVSYGIQLSKKFDFGTSVSAGPSYTRSPLLTDTRMSLTISQPLLRGIGREAGLSAVRRAEFSVYSSEQSLSQSKVDIGLQTITTYYEAQRQRQTADNNRALVDKLKQHLVLAGKKEKAGLATPMDTYRAVIRLKDAEDAFALADSTYVVLIDQLRLLLNLPSEKPLELAAAGVPELDPVRAEQEPLRDNVELKQRRAEVEEASRAARVADNAALPDIRLELGYNSALAGFTTTLPPQQWSISLQSTTDLFRSAERSNAERARVIAATQEVSMSHRTDDLRRRVRQQLSDVAAAKARIAVREEQIREARGKLALAEVKFSNDMADNFDIIESETELQRAELGLLDSQTAYALGVYGLRALTGHLTEEN